MTLTITQIKKYLKENGISYEFVKPVDLQEKYELASLKHIISKGLYYLEKPYIEKQDEIEKSLIITNASKENFTGNGNNSFLIVENPQLIFYSLCRTVMPRRKKTGIHSTAIIDDEATVGENCYIGPYTIVGKCTIEPNCYIDSHVVIGDNVIIKKNTTIDSNSYIGVEGVTWSWDENMERVVQPQFGGLVIEENCFIGTDVSVSKGVVNENALIKKGSMIAHGSKIGHGSILEEKCYLANNVSLAGNSWVGARTFLGSGSVLSSQVRIGEDCVVGAGAVVTKSFLESFIVLAGVPAKIIRRITDNEKLKGVPKRVDLN